MNPILAIDIPNPIDVITSAAGSTVGWAWDKVAEGIAKWVLGAVAYFVEGVINFLLTSARPDVESAWFSGAGSPYATVRGIAIALLLAFLFLGIIQGLMAGDVGAMIRRIGADLPAAVFGMVATTIVVGKLLELTDALSARVLANSDGQAVHFLSGFGVTVTGATQGFAAVLIGLVAVIAAFLVWVELMVRSVLVYILVAISPLSFAAMVWPSARGVLRRTVELLLAVILSKLVICIALSVGVAALGGAGTASDPNSSGSDQAAASMGTLFVGTAILAMAAFAPFLILKLIPWAESALVAQGVSRGPVRGAQSTMSNVYYANSLTRLAGGSGHGGVSSAGNGWNSGARAVGSGAASGSAGSVGAGGAAAGPAIAVTAGAAAASKVATTTTRSVQATAETSGGQSPQTRPGAADRAPAPRRRSNTGGTDAPKREDDR
jgi:hypothetical protein